MITEINNLNEVPQKGKVVLFVTFNSSPCKKFLNYSKQAISILENEKNPAGASYFQIFNTNEIKEALRICLMPTTIVFVDGKEMTRFTGHFWSNFQIADYISKGFNK